MAITKKHNFLLSLIYLLIFGVFLWSYQNNPAFQVKANIAIHNAQVFTQDIFHRITGKDLQPLKQDPDINQENDPEQPKDARWQQKSATVYINTNNKILRSATETAIKEWNKTKSFTFITTSDKKSADIVVSVVDEQNNGAAGLTNTSMNAATGYYIHSSVHLNSFYLLNPAFGYSQQRIVNTAEHELGHAIGLQHTDQISVMQPAGSYYSIQPDDIKHVNDLYAKKPQPVQQDSNNQVPAN